MGDALLQKTYTVDFLTKKRVKNNGFVPQYYVENDHEDIPQRLVPLLGVLVGHAGELADDLEELVLDAVGVVLFVLF